MNRQEGNGSTAAAQAEFQHNPWPYLTGAIITVIVEMKAQFSEVFWNKSHSDSSGNNEEQICLLGSCDGSEVARITLTFHPFFGHC